MIYKIIKQLISGIFLITSISIADMIIIQDLERVAINPGEYDYFPAFTAADSEPYVAGGLVFTYPAGLFSEAPRVTLAIEDTSMVLTTTNITAAWISQNSAAQTTVMVVMDDGSGGYTEVPTNAVNVHLIATSRP